jgi:hypothetical protein
MPSVTVAGSGQGAAITARASPATISSASFFQASRSPPPIAPSASSRSA